MGAWGPNLYECDDAGEIVDAVRDIVRNPIDGDDLLTLLQQTLPYDDPDDDTASIRCIVMADQIHQYGVACPNLFAAAERMISSGQDDRYMAELGMSAKDRSLRQAELHSLLEKWQTPNPTPRNRRVISKPQSSVVFEGDIWICPTEGRNAANVNCSLKELDATFKPDGWSAFLIARTGMRLGLFPTAFVMRLHVDTKDKPTLAQCQQAVVSGMLRRWLQPEPTPLAQWAPVTKSDLNKLRAEKLTTVNLNAVQLEQHFKLRVPNNEPPVIHNALAIVEQKFGDNADDWDISVPTDIRVAELIHQQDD